MMIYHSHGRKPLRQRGVGTPCPPSHGLSLNPAGHIQAGHVNAVG